MVLRPFKRTPQDVSRAVVGSVGVSRPRCLSKPKQHDAVNTTRQIQDIIMQLKMTEKMLGVAGRGGREGRRAVQPPLLRFVFAMSCHHLPPA
jgi:hypothetical protein